MPKKLLIVDDEDAERDLLKFLLKDYDLETYWATDGREGVDMAVKHRPDLIVMDHKMPHMTGFEAIREIRSDDGLRSVPVIFFTVKQFDPKTQELFGLEGIDYLHKPFEEEDLVRLIEKHLGKLKLQAGALLRETGIAPGPAEGPKVVIGRASDETRGALPPSKDARVVEAADAGDLTAKLESEKPRAVLLKAELAGVNTQTAAQVLSSLYLQNTPAVLDLGPMPGSRLRHLKSAGPVLFLLQPIPVKEAWNLLYGKKDPDR